MESESIWKRVFAPLRSRKTRVALVTILTALAVEFGLEVSEEMILAIVGVGVSVILGIAHEDAGKKANPGTALPLELMEARRSNGDGRAGNGAD